MRTNIKPIGIMQNGLTIYSFDDDELHDNFPHIGLSSEEIEKVFPYAVKTLDDGFKVVDYGLVP